MLIKGLSQRVISAALALCITVTGLSVSTSKVLAIGEPVSVHFNYKVKLKQDYILHGVKQHNMKAG